MSFVSGKKAHPVQKMKSGGDVSGPFGGSKAHPVQKLKSGGSVAPPLKSVNKALSEGVGKGARIEGKPFPKPKDTMPNTRINKPPMPALKATVKAKLSPQRG